MTLLELSTEYREAARALQNRIDLLEELMNKAETDRERMMFCERIRTLQILLRGTRDMYVLTEHYYEKGYHRSGRYTV